MASRLVFSGIHGLVLPNFLKCDARARRSPDRELLAKEISEPQVLMPAFDLTVTGFEIEQIEIPRDVAGLKSPTAAEPPATLRTGLVVTRGGDSWQIGEHRLQCADALDTLSYDRLLRGVSADLVVTNPPYKVPIAGHVTGQTHR